MRLLHTADWHLGRTLEGRSRLEEQAAVLNEMVELADAEAIDVVLVAGDVFDSVNPPAAAEQLFYETMARLVDNGRRQVVVIAGNHDHPDRLTAATPLAAEQGIVLLGYPVWETIHMYVPSTGETLCLAALPYPSEARLNELLSDSPQAHLLQEAYDIRVQQCFRHLSRAFSPRTVNVAMSHLFVAGGAASDSERPIEVGGAYTVRPSSLPMAQYVALGHLHRPQAVRHAPAPARYAGSPLAYSFSEAGYAKSVTVVDVRPGEPAVIEEVHLRAGQPLVQWRATEGLAQVYQWMTERRDENAWIDLEVHVEEALSQEDIRRLRQHYPNLVHIRPVYPEQQETDSVSLEEADMPVDELFRQFYRRQTGGAEPEEELVQLFLQLLQEEEAEVAP